MTVTLRTATPVDLNDGIRYELVGFDLGQTQRDEAWLENMWSPEPVLTASQDRKTKVTIQLHVYGRLTANGAVSPNTLRTNVETVRNEFSARSNALTWGFGPTLVNISTYPSPIDPVPFEQSGYFVHNLNQVLQWTFQVWRAPYYQNQSAPIAI